MRRAQLGIDGANSSIWLCTNCGQCVQTCPRDVPIPEVFRAWREWQWQQRETEGGLPAILWSIYWNGNPLSQPPSERMSWAEGRDVPLFEADEHEFLLFVGCTASYDPRAQKIAKAVVEILNAASCSYGVLGEQERCCGECVLRMGHRPYFEELALQNIHQFQKAGVMKIITISPHCYDAFRNHYPHGADLEVIHYADFVRDALASGMIELEPVSTGKHSFHDPCLMSRANNVSGVPREVLASFEGIEYVELESSGDATLCCGGGGGRMFLETLPGERFSDLRIEQTSAEGIQRLLTTCPLCISCLEDSRAALGVEGLEILDLAEFVASMIRYDEGEG
jgi:Fe-S oxidoreductase